MHKSWFSLSLLVLAGLSSVPMQAVTFGQPDGARHPWVGTMLFQAGDGFYYSCSATLLAPTVMVTAAHCTIENGVKNVATWVKFDPVISFPGLDKAKSVAAYLDNPKNGWIGVTEVIPHPQYHGSYPNTYDVGIVILKSAVDPGVFGALPPLGFLQTIGGGNSGNNLFNVVGYGMQGYIKPFHSDTWERYFGQIRLVELKSTFDGDAASAKFTNNPGKTSGGSCYGDSGGPVFYSTTNMIVAVVSWGITPCIGVDYNFRIDTPAAQDFIRKYLP
ncbi:MAG: trypsin-like serine protease [Acidobacteria bacterium]|nr:trypsin-like serine protease [Acidobacteriota bacterium]